ncbi:MAG: TatD family hydrolase [Phycisphaerae bacterium]
MLIDTHCHLTHADLASQIDGVLARAAAADVCQCIAVATSPRDAAEAAAIAAPRANIFVAAAIHPHEAGHCTDADFALLREFQKGMGAARELPGRVVAVGEIGLDFHYNFAPPPRQEEVFRAQLRLACDAGRPVIIHAREAEQRVCEILGEFPALRDRVVFHCFSGGAELARRILDAGSWLSFTGVVTFKNANAIRDAARAAPADRIMVETDAPYMTPEPVRKIRPNEPALVVHTARFLADLRGETLDTFAEHTSANARRFFSLPEIAT